MLLRSSRWCLRISKFAIEKKPDTQLGRARNAPTAHFKLIVFIFKNTSFFSASRSVGDLFILFFLNYEFNYDDDVRAAAPAGNALLPALHVTLESSKHVMLCSVRHFESVSHSSC